MEADTSANGLISDEDVLRAQFYGLLSRLLMGKPDEAILNDLRTLAGDDTDIGAALGQIGECARVKPVQDIHDEYGELFHGYGAGGELIPNASFYMTGFVYDKPLTALRTTMAGLGVERVADYHEPEDSMSFVLELMHGLIAGTYGSGDLEEQKSFFEQHIAPWGFRFFEDLEQADSADFYRPVGRLGQVFLGVERDAFGMAR